MIAITHDGQLWHYTGSYSFELRPDIPFAIGSGSEYALGAIAMGADAKKAIEVASKYDVYTNDHIQVANLVTEEEVESTEGS